MRLRLHVETSGNGPALALLHGWGLHGGIWQSIRGALARHFTLHIIDLPGHGYSKHIEAASLAGMGHAVVESLPERFHLCGWSLGGQVAMHVAAYSPARVEKLVLVSSTPSFIQRADWAPAMAPGVLEDFAARLKTDYRKTLLNFLRLQVLKDPHADAHALSLFHDLCEMLFARGEPHPAALSDGLSILRDSDLRDVVTRIDHAALVVHGDRDTLIPRLAGDWLAQNLVDAHYLPLQRCGHVPFLSHPARFVAAVIEFLETP